MRNAAASDQWAMGGAVSKALKGLTLVAVVGWCAFWWGHYLGFRSAGVTEISNAKFELEFLRQAIQSNSLEAKQLQVLTELRQQRLATLEATTDFSIAEFIIAPIASPIAAYTLSQVRDGDSR
jgi:hypothetical protein